ncbi:hypothetical protein E2R51_07645 [Jeotgalibacillus sp. S-D1]|uniref:SurA N-terminal domain-containing protein n=1 Tax=Jeotgalibacillus sp. S-D1 TaxID=2552189 RepID=UPI00105A6119|nr:SurA N-terminal domain-containing protein [Jeotgalibacillus sp. S-D1]TDL32550.1 hypothetical protein E2R51_07645 [Jeotgalibacillus sp. S-D1]
MNLKKILLPFAAGALALGLAACNDEEDKSAEEPKQEEASKEDQAAAEESQKKLEEQQVDEKEVVAVVNDQEILGEDYNAALGQVQGQMQQAGQDPTSKEAAEQVKTQTLDTLVNQTLILQKAEEAELTASEEEIDEEYNAFQEQFGGEEAMNEMLEAEGMKPEALREQIAESIKFEKYINETVPTEEVTEKEIQEYYDQAAAQSKESGQEMPPLEEVSENIKTGLEQQKQQEKLAQHVEELKADASIDLKI